MPKFRFFNGGGGAHGGEVIRIIEFVGWRRYQSSARSAMWEPIMNRRHFLHLTAGAAALPAVSRFALAQAYPTRPITMIVPVAPGSSGDVIARVIAERMKGALGQPIIIENISGADGSIGVGRLARARPDGYTIDIGYLGAHVLNGAFYSLPYDLLDDFEPISLLTTTSFVLYARKSLPAKDLSELIPGLRPILTRPPPPSPQLVSASLSCSFRKKRRHILAWSLIAAAPTLSRTWWPARSTCSST